MYGLIFMILGHGGSLKGKSGQFFLLFDRGRISDQKEIRNSTEAKILAMPTPRLSEAGT